MFKLHFLHNIFFIVHITLCRIKKKKDVEVTHSIIINQQHETSSSSFSLHSHIYTIKEISRYEPKKNKKGGGDI